jgi:hypothetical protein
MEPEPTSAAWSFGSHPSEGLEAWFFANWAPVADGWRTSWAVPTYPRDRHSAPLLGGDLSDRFGKRPHVARRVLCRVLARAELKILQLGHDPRPLRLGPLAVGGRIFDPYHHRVSDLPWSRRPAVFPYVSDDDGSYPKGELRAVVVADPGAFDEAERSAEPVDRLTHVRVDEDGGSRSPAGTERLLFMPSLQVKSAFRLSPWGQRGSFRAMWGPTSLPLHTRANRGTDQSRPGGARSGRPAPYFLKVYGFRIVHRAKSGQPRVPYGS